MHIFTCDAYVGKSLKVFGEWAESEISLLLQLVTPQTIFVDIGANIGTHTVAIAPHVSHVVAFEPQPRVFQVLCANVVANQLANVTTKSEAIGDEHRMVYVPPLNFDAPANNVGAARISDTGIPAMMATVDDFCMGGCDLVKMDIEGHELKALHGAEQTIARFRPVMYLEHHENKEQVEAWLRERGYRLFIHDAPCFNPDNVFGVKEDFCNGYGERNLIAWPQEKPLHAAINKEWEI